MAFVIADRVRETSTTIGTGSFTLSGAALGYQTFASALASGDTTYYTIADQGGTNWEVGIGTFTSPSTLARTTILSSSNTGSIVTFGAGTKDVFISLPASKTNTNDQPNVISVNSASDALRITQTGAGNALVVEDSANPDATPFVVDASGQVIRGYTSAIATVNYAGNSATPALQNISTGTPGASIGTFLYNASSSQSPQLTFSRSLSATVGTPGSVASGNILGAIGFNGDDGTNFVAAASITAAVDGTPGTNDMPGRLVFSTTADGAATPTERMRIDNAGLIGIAASSSSGNRINIAGNSVASGASFTNLNSSVSIQSDVTSAYVGYRSSYGTAASAFTLGTVSLFRAAQGSLGASSAVTTQYGFEAQSTLIGATNNYGFYSNIASGTGRWNFYAAGTADNFFGGPTTLSVSSSSDALRITQTGAGNALVVEDSANPDATPFVVDTSGRLVSGYTSSILLQASSYLAEFLGSGVNYPLAAGYTGNSATGARFALTKNRSADWSTQTIVVSGDTLGDIEFQGSDGTNAIVGARITGAVDGTPGTNDMPGRLVFLTTADGASSPTERMRINNAGLVGIGTGSLANNRLRVQFNLTDAAATSSAILNDGTHTLTANSANLYYGIDSQAALNQGAFNQTTSLASGGGIRSFRSFTTVSGTSGTVTAAAGHTADVRNTGAGVLTNGAGFVAQAVQNTGGGTLTNAIGFYAAPQTGGTNNYGFYSDVASASGRWNFYANGTADNYFAGQVQLGAGSAATPALSTTGDTNTGMFFPTADTIAFAEGGAESMRIDSSGNVGIGTSSPAYRLTSVGGQVQLSPGTSAQEGVRLSRSAGVMTFNGINNDNNAYNALAFATGASEAVRIDSSGNALIGTTTATSKLTVNGDVAGTFFVNPTTVSANYTIPTNYNAMTAGPITVNSGVTVTVPSGSSWTVT